MGFERLFWVLAIPFTTILIAQFIMALFGLGDHHTTDHPQDSADHDVPHFKMLTVRGAVAFFAMFGWVGIAMIHSGHGKVATLIASFFAGFIMMAVVSMLLYFMARMEQSGNVKVDSLVGHMGRVYLTIPLNGVGKVNVNTATNVVEVKAKAKEELVTGMVVRVTEVVNDIVTVEKI